MLRVSGLKRMHLAKTTTLSDPFIVGTDQPHRAEIVLVLVLARCQTAKSACVASWQAGSTSRLVVSREFAWTSTR
jgi:hypothetical protein